jgi:hypothetical protein
VVLQQQTGARRQKRPNRLILLAPVLLLGLMAAGWSVFWFVARNGVVGALDDFVSNQAELGRHWTCPGRSVGGFPFRFEIRCEQPGFSGLTPNGPVEASVARFVALAQAYAPNHVLAEVTGPLQVRAGAGGETLVLDWRTFQASINGADAASRRVALLLTDPVATVTLARGDSFAGRAQALEVHVRQDPTRPASDSAYDVAVSLAKASVPMLDAVLGGAEPADIAIQAAVTRTDAFGPGRREDQIERWRVAGGRIDIDLVSFERGGQRLTAKGTVGIDDLHRPQGMLEASVAGLERLLKGLGGGQRAGLGGLLAGGLAILGGGRAEAPPAAEPAGKPPLTPLPPLRLANGRAYLGPIPLFAVPPLY